MKNANFAIEQRVNNNPLNAIIYGTDNDMFALSECEKIYVDKTFKSTPCPFKQIFTVHGMYFDHTIHFGTCPLDRKREEDYTFFLATIKARIQH